MHQIHHPGHQVSWLCAGHWQHLHVVTSDLSYSETRTSSVLAPLLHWSCISVSFILERIWFFCCWQFLEFSLSHLPSPLCWCVHYASLPIRDECQCVVTKGFLQQPSCAPSLAVSLLQVQLSGKVLILAAYLTARLYEPHSATRWSGPRCLLWLMWSESYTQRMFL